MTYCIDNATDDACPHVRLTFQTFSKIVQFFLICFKGKTTLVEYVAARCGHPIVRINNHEHTDVQEYTGAFSTDSNGLLSFQDGLLVRALKLGHWVILDELNLAPSEVLGKFCP